MLLGTMKSMELSDSTFREISGLESEARRLVASLVPSADQAALVTLSGELGAGKTSFVQALARTLGVTEHVTSPTFVLAKTYPLSEDGAFRQLVHIDAYRLTEANGLASISFDDFMKDPANLILLEWPEMVKEELPTPAVRISIEALPDGARRFTYA